METINGDTSDNSVEVVMMNVKSEPVDGEPMEEVYNDLPPSLTPEVSIEVSDNPLITSEF